MKLTNNILIKSQAVALSLLIAATAASAQERVAGITMAEAVNIATTQNSSVLSARLDEKIARENYRQTNAIFLPQVNISYTGFITDNPLNAFGFKLQQKIVAPADFNPATLNEPKATSDIMTRFSAQQPVFNLDLIYQRKSAAVQLDAFRFRTQRNIEFIGWQVKQVYLQLELSWKAVEVLEEALLTARATYKQTNDRYQQGLLQKSDLLNVQVQLKGIETRLMEAKANVKNASDYLNLLMNKNQGIVYRPATSELDSVSQTMAVVIPSDRSDLQAMEAARSSYDLMIKSSKLSYIPRINAFGDYQLHDNRMFGFNANGYLAGIQLSWDVFKGFQVAHKTNSLTLEKEKMTLQLDEKKAQEQVELNKASRALAESRYKIEQQKEAVAHAGESFRIVQNRYGQGLTTTTELLQVQTQLSQEKLRLTEAYYERNNAIIYIEFLTAIHQ